MTVGECQRYFANLDLPPRQTVIAEHILTEIRSRLEFMGKVGVEYLTMDRPTATLSGGEAQRIRLANQIGSALVGVTYVLDEPSIGLHQRDNDRLIETLKDLRNQLGKATPEQLAAMLEKMMKNLENLDRDRKGKLSAKDRAELGKKLQKDSKEISDMLKHEQLKKLSDKIAKADSSSDGGRIPPEVVGLTAKYCELLEKELFHALMKRKVQRSGVTTGGVPESYRRLVEEYFKALAEDRDLEEK